MYVLYICLSLYRDLWQKYSRKIWERDVYTIDWKRLIMYYIVDFKISPKCSWIYSINLISLLYCIILHYILSRNFMHVRYHDMRYVIILRMNQVSHASSLEIWSTGRLTNYRRINAYSRSGFHEPPNSGISLKLTPRRVWRWVEL